MELLYAELSHSVPCVSNNQSINPKLTRLLAKMTTEKYFPLFSIFVTVS